MVVIYAILFAYIIYDHYSTGVDLSHMMGENDADKPSNDQYEKSSLGTTKTFTNRDLSTTPLQPTTQGLTGGHIEEMTGGHIEIYGRVENGKKYAVFGCTTPAKDYRYAFYLPLSVVAWLRINYQSIVIIIGTKKQWSSHKVLGVILHELETLGAVLIFIDSKPEQATMLGQVSRLFVPVLMPWDRSNSTEEPYLITSDADIWPLSHALFDLTPGTKIVSSNSECCGSFKHRERMYKMLPMCYIGMHLSTWSEVMNFDVKPNEPITNSQYILSYLQKDFGDIVTKKVVRGGNVGWYMDQHLISIRIQEWAAKNPPNSIQYIRRDTRRDRIDRAYWNAHDITDKKDSHLLLSGYLPGTWERLLPLLSQMYNKNVTSQAVNYRETFLKTVYKEKH